MARKRTRRANWPYRLAWLGLWLALLLYVGIQTVATALSYGRRSYGIDWSLSLVASCFDATIAVFFFVVGACIGSFLNVVAYRLPLGRFIGGHSSCPYCQTPIDSSDNVPILAWIKLRGRCRTCRLPISAQYPLVELTVAILFLVVYITEFASGGANLPGTQRSADSVLRVTVTLKTILQIFSYLFILSSLVAAALIAVKKRRAPLSLFFWALLPQLAFALAIPETVIAPWRSIRSSGTVDSRLDAIITLVCGLAAGIALARLFIPLLYRGVDRGLGGADAKSAAARQMLGAMAVASCLVGWQSSVSLAWLVVLTALCAVVVLRIVLGAERIQAARVEIVDLTVWVWLGLLLYRSNWNAISNTQWLPDGVPEVARHVFGALLLAPLVWLFARMADPSENSPPTEVQSPTFPTIELSTEENDQAHAASKPDAP